jgi:glycosyltransferase involved in cell wall biosynthesis
MRKKILICLDRLKYPFSGLGRVSEDFAKAITTHHEFDFYFLVPDGDFPFLPKEKCIHMSWLKNLSSAYMKGFDLVHIPHQLPSYPFSKASKTVLTIHDLNFLYTKNSAKKEKYRKKVQDNINKADAVTFISQFTQNDCFDNLTFPNNVATEVIYNGVSQLTPPSPRPNWCPDSPFLFSLGVMLDKKNFHVLFPFVKLLPDDIKLVIAGDTNTKYGQYLTAQLSTLGIENKVLMPGAISEEQKSYLYQHCQAFVFPSIAEGFGLPVIEAMRIGKPVFCSNKTSLAEIGSKFAFFWNDFDPLKMKDVFERGMQQFSENPSHKNEQIKYAQSFTWERNAMGYIHLYNQLLNGNK